MPGLERDILFYETEEETDGGREKGNVTLLNIWNCVRATISAGMVQGEESQNTG